MRVRPLFARLLAVTLLSGALVSAQGSPSQPARGPRRVEVLILGSGTGSHDSTRTAPLLKAALAQYGYNFSYTTEVTDLNPANLAQYDALILTGTTGNLGTAEERALMDFVSNGKGLLAVHAAGASFGNSSTYATLIGAGTVAAVESKAPIAIQVRVANPSHPIASGLDAFQITDEPLTFSSSAADRAVLLTRSGEPGPGAEPIAWARSQGGGRVFYTSLGHDERSWGDPHFHQLMRNALGWAIGPRVASLLAALKIQPLRYADGLVPVPNYERREAVPKLQAPLTTAEAAKHIQVPPGFELQLFASEPLIAGNPEAMAWDERGRLWIAETKDYPNNLQPVGQGNDVIKILEDTNHDGRADKATVFADKLNIVSSLVFVNGGIIVSQRSDLVFLKDTNGDDKADERRALITGFSARDTHALASSLKYGLDNWIWGAVGYSGFNGTVGGETLTFNQALYRFTRDATRMEHMATFTNNTWGLAFNETGDIFGNTANGEHSDYVAIPRPYYQGVKGLTGDGKKKLDGHYAMQPNTRKIRQVDVQGGFTAAAGHNFYTARSFPREYWNRIAFVNEPTGHVVHRAIIEREGSGFTEKDGWNVAASDDEWFAPVHAEVGPDGALWVLDFYDFIIQHNPTPIGPIAQGYQFANGGGNAYETPLREHARGRVYRVVWRQAPAYKPLSLSVSDPAGLVSALRHDNMFWRLTAQRLLVERGNTDVVPRLLEIASDQTVDAIGLNSPAVHALWTLHGLGVLDGRNASALEVARRALAHPAAGVRKAAQSVLPRTAQGAADLLAARSIADPDLNVRLNALLALSQMPPSVEAGRVLYALSKDATVVADEWLPEAVWIAATKHQDGFLDAYRGDVGLSAIVRTSVRGARGERPAGLDWSSPSQDETDWMTIAAPKVWAETPLGELIGTVWFRRAIDLPPAAAGKPALIRFGIVDDSDVTYINGVRINATTNQRNAPRQYSVPAGVLVAGRNVVAVRISNVNGRGGFVPDPAPAPGLAPITTSPNQGLTGMTLAGEGFSVSLAGDWRAKIEERWTGARRREVLATVPIAEQFLLANSPVADMLRPTTPAPAGVPGAAAASASPDSGSSSATGATRLTLAVMPGQMKYDKNLLTVRAGQRVELTLNNPDDMQHNVVIFKRGAMADYEKELFGSMNEPNAQLRGFVPDSPNVLVASRLLNAGESTVVAFTAPTEPGEYPFVCSFPGHWMLMRGVLRVE